MLADTKPQRRKGKNVSVSLLAKQRVIQEFNSLVDQKEPNPHKVLLTRYGPGTAGIREADGKTSGVPLRHGYIQRWKNAGVMDVTLDTKDVAAITKKAKELPNRLRVKNQKLKGPPTLARFPKSIWAELDKLLAVHATGAGDPHKCIAQSVTASDVLTTLEEAVEVFNRKIKLGQKVACRANAALQADFEAGRITADDLKAGLKTVPKLLAPPTRYTVASFLKYYGWEKSSRKGQASTSHTSTHECGECVTESDGTWRHRVCIRG